MNLQELASLVNGVILTPGNNSDLEIIGCCGADLMSDVLASIQPNALLLTGLCNPQVVRTAEMADVSAIVFVRGKRPPQETLDLAEASGIPIVSSPYGMFELCGRLYQAGLPSLERPAVGPKYECGA
jgi:predicted transcriptional regulator